VRGEVGGIVAAGMEMEFVRDLARGEDCVERNGASVETVVVLVTAIEINLQAGEIDGAREHERAVIIPESRVRRDPKDAAKNA
jgi:hypothetical protein